MGRRERGLHELFLVSASLRWRLPNQVLRSQRSGEFLTLPDSWCVRSPPGSPKRDPKQIDRKYYTLQYVVCSNVYVYA